MAFGNANVDSMESSRSRDQRESDGDNAKEEDSEGNKRQKAAVNVNRHVQSASAISPRLPQRRNPSKRNHLSRRSRVLIQLAKDDYLQI